ncbi:MAG: NAD(P)/FAD-dependent oxidoreductase [Bacillota bacterium]
MVSTIIVIGGGAAGMLAAGAAASRGNHVILLEKNEKLGKKIYITGKGRCNLTNKEDAEGILHNITKNKNFMYSALYTFGSEDIIKIMHQYGTPTKIERGNRVFPSSDKSSDVIKALTKYMANQGVDVRLNAEVKELLVRDGQVKGILLADHSKLMCDKIIVATGGLSYPTTGSTGDGYKFAEKAGHKIISLKPSLVPLETEESWVKELQGLSLKNVSIKAFYNDKAVFEDFGEMIFTHFGISGPIVLSMSNYITSYLEKGRISVEINLKPALNEEGLDKRIQRDFEKYSKKQFKNALNDLLPSKLIPVIIGQTGIPEEKYVNQITKEERKVLVSLLHSLRLKVVKTRPIKEAIITSGGVSVREINPSTMESKLVSGLYFAGEVIDVDALTGGYNLQIAFSTGYLAGINV